MEGDIPHLTPAVSTGVGQQTPPRRASTPEPGSQPHPVIVRNPSNPSTPGVSLDWDNSCLEDPFHAGGQYLSVPGIQQRRRSSTNPEIVDNNQILLVDTDVSSLDLSLERAVQLSSMEGEADAIYEEVDSIMGRISTNPVDDLSEEFLDTFLTRLEGITDDVENRLKMFKSCRIRSA